MALICITLARIPLLLLLRMAKPAGGAHVVVD
jgi:hypothetical protein